MLANKPSPGTAAGTSNTNRIESASIDRILAVARIRIASAPPTIAFGPNLSSRIPPSTAPKVPVMVKRMPKVPISTVAQPNVPAA